MKIYLTLSLYCLAIIAASLLGGWVPLKVKLTHKRLQLANSLIGGFMLGVALLHLLPHALMHASADSVAIWMTAGVLSMFLLERVFHYHQHDIPSHPPHPRNNATASEHGDSHAAAEHSPAAPEPFPKAEGAGTPRPHQHPHEHDCDQTHEHAPHYESAPKLSWGGAAIGLVLHSLIAGVSLGAAMNVDAAHAMMWPGLALFLVIVLHKPFDAMTLLALVTKGGYSVGKAHMINALFAMVVPIGAALFLLGFASEGIGHDPITSNALGFAAGVFLCIALSDLLPELHFHRHDAVKLTLALTAGLALAWAINHFEMKTHSNPHSFTPGSSPASAPDNEGDGETPEPSGGWDPHDHNHDGKVDELDGH